jgi:hypothetical protein
VKVLRNTLRSDRARHQVVVDDGVVEPPLGLPLEAGLVWSELAPSLIASGLLRAIDAGAFGQYCVLTAHLRQLWPINEAPPASYIGQWRLLGELFGVVGEKSRVLARKRQAEANPFARNGKRPQ